MIELPLTPVFANAVVNQLRPIPIPPNITFRDVSTAKLFLEQVKTFMFDPVPVTPAEIISWAEYCEELSSYRCTVNMKRSCYKFTFDHS